MKCKKLVYTVIDLNGIEVIPQKRSHLLNDYKEKNVRVNFVVTIEEYNDSMEVVHTEKVNGSRFISGYVGKRRSPKRINERVLRNIESNGVKNMYPNSLKSGDIKYEIDVINYEIL